MGADSNSLDDQRTYLSRFAAQIPALTESAQLRLRSAHVMIVGVGGVGASATMTIANLGVGRLTIIDPQVLEPDNLNRHPIATDRDIGRLKVTILADLLRRRPHLEIRSIPLSCDAFFPDGVFADGNMIVSTSNTPDSRFAAATIAREHRIPHVFAGIDDARTGFGGVVGWWVPDHPELACQSCFLQGIDPRARGEALVGTVAAVVGGLVGQVALDVLLAGRQERLVAGGNLITINLDEWRLERARIRRHPHCPLCGIRSAGHLDG